MRLPQIFDLRNNPTALVAGSFILAAFMSVAVAWASMLAIESTSQTAIERALLLNGEEWAEVDTSGLQVILSGTAPTEIARFRAVSVAGSKVDSGRVIDQMEVPPPAVITPPEFSIEMLRNESGISMIGLIPAATDREALGARVQEIDRTHGVTDFLEAADYPVPARWDDALDFALGAVELLARSKISIRADRVTIEAIADSAEQKSAWEKRLRGSVPGGVRLGLDISAPRPVITPYTLRFTIDDEGARFDACTVRNGDGRAAITAAGIAAGVKGAPNCTIGLGEPSPDWPDAVSLGIAALRDLGGGSLTFADADVTLIAAEGTPQNTFDRVIGELETDLPDVFSLHAVLPEPTSAASQPSGPPEFVATLSPEGDVQLRGRIADAQERTIVESFARARFGVGKVYSAMRLDPELPRGWSVRALAGLEALDQLANGSVVVQPQVVDVRGATGNEGASAEISRVLSEKLGEAEDFRVNVRYEEELDPLAALPTPQECAASINAAMAASKITFAPGSAEIELASVRTVDGIAEILKGCPDVAMEIGGYTDSQGREEMNQALSQRRAEAVLSALLARRVLTANLTAHGYGEENPIADNDTEEGREANRRIEFHLIGAGSEAQVAEAGTGADTEAGTDGDSVADTGDEPNADGTEPATETEADSGEADMPAVRPAARPEDDAGSADAPQDESDAATDAPDSAEPDEAETDSEADAAAEAGISAAEAAAAAAQGAADSDATVSATATPDEPASDEAATDDAETDAASEEPAPEPAPEDAPQTEPVVVDPDLAGIRPRPRPAQPDSGATE
jgi:OOP family OmpA-OmpF porin